MPSNRELDCLVAERVLGWKVVEYGREGEFRYYETGDDYIEESNFLPSSDVSDDYAVLQHVREKWLDADDYHEANGRWNVFWRSLAEILRSRDPYYRDTVNQYELYYMQEYRPGDYSRAALAALGVEVDQ